MKGLLLSLLVAAAALSPARASQLEGAGGGAERVAPMSLPSTPQMPVQLSLDFSSLPSIDGNVVPLVPLNPGEAASAAQNASTQGQARLVEPAAIAGASAQAPAESAKILPFVRPQAQGKAQAENPASAARALEGQTPAAAELTEKAGEISAEDGSARAGAMFREFAAQRRDDLQPVEGRRSGIVQRLLPSFLRRKTAQNVAAPEKPKRTYVRKLIFWNVVVYLLTLPLMPAAGAAFGVVPEHMRSVVLHLDVLGIAHAAFTSFSYLFMHASPSHLIGNMVGLFLFGRFLEKWAGRSAFKKIYYISGLAAALAGALLIHTPGAAVIGASTAIFGVVGAYVAALIILRPWARPATDARWWKKLWTALQNTGLALLGALGILMIAQNVVTLAVGGSLAGGVYVLGHVVGALVGIDVAVHVLRRRAQAKDEASS